MRLITFGCVDGQEGARFTTPWLPALDSEQTLVLVAGDPGSSCDPEPFRELRRAYPLAHFLGGVAPVALLRNGDAGPTPGPRPGETITIAIARFESAWLRSATVAVPAPDASHAVGIALGKQLIAPRLRGVVVVADGGGVVESEFVRGLHAGLPTTVAVSGFCSRGRDGRGAWVLSDGAPTSGRVTAIGFHGDDCRFEIDAIGTTTIAETARSDALAFVVAESARLALRRRDGDPTIAPSLLPSLVASVV